jgi:hypothetical protein
MDINKLEKAISKARDEAESVGLDSITVPFKETDMIMYYLELLRTKNKTGVWIRWTTAYYKGRDNDHEPIWGRRTYYICSNCRRRTVIADPFCPSCGASMEKEM